MRPQTPPIGEVFRRSTDDLPLARHDLSFEQLNTAAAETLMREKVIVLSKYIEEDTAEDTRLTARNFLYLQAAAMAGKKLLEKSLPISPDRLPHFLRRRPITTPADNQWLPYKTRFAVHQIEQLNEELYQQPSVAEVYGAYPHRLTTVVFNHTPTDRWFPRHQDSQGIRGIGFALQTAPTLWHVEASQTDPTASDFTFQTDVGDVVVLLERAKAFDFSKSLEIGGGYTRFEADGSVVHSGKNLSEKTRFGINLFSVEFTES